MTRTVSAMVAPMATAISVEAAYAQTAAAKMSAEQIAILNYVNPL
jgi:hypothetical protein